MTRQEAIRIFERVRKRTASVDTIDICDAMIGLLTTLVAREQQVGERKRAGRPPLGDRAMTVTERVRRWREKRRKGLVPAQAGKGKS